MDLSESMKNEKPMVNQILFFENFREYIICLLLRLLDFEAFEGLTCIQESRIDFRAVPNVGQKCYSFEVT